MLYFFNVVVRIKTLTPENSWKTGMIPVFWKLPSGLAKKYKKETESFQRCQESSRKTHALFCLYHFRMCGIALFSTTWSLKTDSAWWGSGQWHIELRIFFSGYFKIIFSSRQLLISRQAAIKKTPGLTQSQGYGNITVFIFLTSLQKNGLKTESRLMVNDLWSSNLLIFNKKWWPIRPISRWIRNLGQD